MSQQYTPQQIAALDAHIAAVVQLLPSRPWRPADPPVLSDTCIIGVWRKRTFEPCGKLAVCYSPHPKDDSGPCYVARCVDHE